MHLPALLLSTCTALLTLGCASSPRNAGPLSVSGTWKTETPASYIIEHSERRPQGTSVEHDQLELLERTASVKWLLNERPNGLVTGTNEWVAFGPDGETLFSGTEPLLGVHDLERLVLEEAADEKTDTPQMVFHCAFDGPDRIRVIGYELGTNDLVAFRFVLLRD
ncbi:hypothetical protein N9293_00835 [Planctomycetota bacterium]|jgi:hypothetical protein|nr:hypothetical protein [Planctomycetota bacterium]MDC1043755.1 hypothetical protein [bacterium]